MTKPTSKKAPKAGRWSRLAAAAAAVGMSGGIANGMALAANSEANAVAATPPSVVRRVVVTEPQPIVVVIPRTDAEAIAVSRPVAAVTAEAPPAPAPVAVQAPATTPVAESSGS